MLTIPLEKLAYIVAKAREFDAEVEPVDENNGSNEADDGERDILEDTPDNPTYQELVDAIKSLNDIEKIELLALVFVGRGDFSKDEWRDALEEAAAVRNESETSYLTGTPLLADYLEEAIAEMGYSLEEFEIDRM